MRAREFTKQNVAEGSENNRISFQVQKGKNKFATTLSIGNNPVGVYQYDANTGRSIAEVYPEFKGKGLGKLLVLHAIYTAAKLGLDFQEDESRTSEYDNVLDSLSSNGYIVDDDGYWYVTGEGEQFLKQSLKQGVAEGSYREGGSITHDGVEYDFDSVMSIAEKLPTKTCSVDKLSWILKYDTPNKERLERADITVPLIVTKSSNSKLAAIDGLHRLAKAVRDNVKTLPVKYVSPKMLPSAKISKQGVAEARIDEFYDEKANKPEGGKLDRLVRRSLANKIPVFVLFDNKTTKSGYVQSEHPVKGFLVIGSGRKTYTTFNDETQKATKDGNRVYIQPRSMWNASRELDLDEGVAEDNVVNEIDYASTLANLSMSDQQLIKSSSVVGTIGSREVFLFTQRNSRIYFFKDNDAIDALVYLFKNRLLGIKNYSRNKGLVYNLLQYIVNMNRESIKLTEIDKLTPDGIQWILRQIKTSSDFVITDQRGNKIDSSNLYDEWELARTSGKHGSTEIVIAPSDNRKNIRENESRLMPMDIWGATLKTTSSNVVDINTLLEMTS